LFSFKRKGQLYNNNYNIQLNSITASNNRLEVLIYLFFVMVKIGLVIWLNKMFSLKNTSYKQFTLDLKYPRFSYKGFISSALSHTTNPWLEHQVISSPK